VVPGTASQNEIVRFTWTAGVSDFLNEIGVYQVQDSKGTVNGVDPSSAKYAATVLSSSGHQILFDPGAGIGSIRTLSFAGGTRLGYYLIQHNTSATFLAQNPGNLYGIVTNAFFSFSGANPDLFNHVQQTRVRNGDELVGWNDQDGGMIAPSTFTACIFNVHSVGTNSTFTQPFDNHTLQTPGPVGSTVVTTFKFDPSSSAFSSELGVFQVDAANGRIGDLAPGDPGYAAAALSRANHQEVFSTAQDPGAIRALALQGGSFYGFYLIQNSSWGSWHATNPGNAVDGGPLALFSFLPANPDGFDHVRLVSDNKLAFEDGTFGGDQDFNDMVTSITFGTIHQAPTVTAQLANDTGSSNTDHITSDPTVTGMVTSIAPPVKLLAGFGSTPVSAFTDVSSTVHADGTFTLSRALLTTINGGSLPDGSYTLHLQAINKNGDKSAVFDLSFTLLTSSPITFDLDPLYDTPPVGDKTTMFNLVTLRGHTSANAVVTLLQTGASITSDASGNFAFGGVSLAPGTNLFTARVVDVAGNTNQDQETFTRVDSPIVHQGIADVSVSQPTSTTTTNIDLSNVFTDPNFNNMVEFKTSVGNVDIQLEDKLTPKTVANFLSYVNSGAYNNTIIHRSVTPSQNAGIVVEQGGGFALDSTGTLNATHITTSPPVVNEFHLSNLTGTIAMAKTSDPNSATSEFFFNLADNTALDNPNNSGGFTVFGHVVGNSLSVLQSMVQLPTFQLENADGSANNTFQTTPLRNTPAGTTVHVADVNANNAVVLTQAALLPQLTFSATSSNPGLVTASITNNQLTLTYPTAGATGTATITVTATDRAGNAYAVSTSFQVTVS
jgi:cyclophilin family peptidyl-prolyl cis-trans isomerase